MSMKLNTVLALTDGLRSKYKNMIVDFAKFFSKSQGSFLGEKKTYTPRPNTIDDSSKRGVKRVVTTVDEKIKWFIDESKDFINLIFSQEKTNSIGLAKAELVVDGISWGVFTSLELLRLKSLLESSELGNIENMISEIPVRSDSEIWEESTDPDYAGMNIFQSPLYTGVSKTTTKEHYILEDPNVIKGDVKNYTPQVSVKDTVVELGDYTRQTFSGEWNHTQRANVLKRRSIIITAVLKALKEANDCESVESMLKAEKIFGYLFYGK